MFGNGIYSHLKAASCIIAFNFNRMYPSTAEKLTDIFIARLFIENELEGN